MYKDFISIFKFVLPYRKRFFLAILCMVLSAGLFGGAIYLIKPLIDEVIVKGDFNKIYQIIGILVILSVFKGISDYGNRYFMFYIGHKAMVEIRNRICAHFRNLSLGYFGKVQSGRLMSLVTNDVMMVQDGVTNGIAILILQTLKIAVLLGWLFYIDYMMALFSLVVFPLAILPMIKYGQKIRRASGVVMEKIGRLNSVLHEMIYGMTLVRAFGMEKHEENKFGETNNDYFNESMKVIRASSAMTPIVELIGVLTLSFLLWLGMSQISSGRLSSGQLIQFVASLLMLLQPINALSEVNSIVQKTSASSKRIFELLNTHTEVEEKENPVVVSKLEKSVVYEDVNFEYEKNDPVLAGVEFEIRKGEVVALVGTSGSGKSTIVNLLLRFYDPQKGRILIDGVDVRDASLLSLRRSIGIVSQETILFNDTVKNNIAYGDEGRSFEEVVESAKIANSHDFIMDLPKGYDTIIGERGALVSGGERQRLAIARAVLKNPPILVLDEATSSLDIQSELLVREAIKRIMEGRTVLVIAHRLSTVTNADRILVLQHGRIVQTGKHQDLINQEGLYKILFEMQFQV